MNLETLLTSSITIASQASVDTHGDPSYGSPRTVRARIQPARGRDEEEIEHEHVILCGEVISPDDRIWLPGDDTTSADAARRPLSVEEQRDRWGEPKLWTVLL